MATGQRESGIYCGEEGYIVAVSSRLMGTFCFSESIREKQNVPVTIDVETGNTQRFEACVCLCCDYS